MSESVWRRNDQWVGAQIEDAYVMLDIEAGEYVSFNASATDIWAALEQPRTSAQIVAELCKRYTVAPETCTMAVNRVLTELAAKGLIK